MCTHLPQTFQPVHLSQGSLPQSLQKVPKQPAYSSNNIAEDFLKLGDFKLGGSVIVYSREFHIVDCDQRTKEYCKEVEGWGEEDLRRGTYPEDRCDFNCPWRRL